MTQDKKTEEQIAQLQLVEQNLQSFLIQKQSFQTQLLETNNALKEMDSSKDKVYKIIGTVMVVTDKEALIKDLNEKKDLLNLRIKNIEKQEKELREKGSKIQEEVIKKLKHE